MGCFLHYHEKHDIKYGDTEAFNYQHEEIYELLSRYDCQVFADNCEDGCYADSFSVPREQIAHMVRCLGKRKQDAVLMRSHYEKDVVWTVRDAFEFFREAYRNSPKDHSDIYFEWF